MIFVTAKRRPTLSNRCMAELEQLPTAHTDDLGAILRASRLTRKSERFEAHDRIFSEGDAGGAVYVVRSGRLALLLSLAPEEFVRVRAVGPGEVVGLASAMNRAPYCKTAVALEKTVLDKFDAHDVVDFLAAYPESQVKALTFLCADADAMQRVLAHAKSADRTHHTHKRT